MEKYKHPEDEARLRALFADFVTSGKSVMLSEDGHMPDPFSDYGIQEVAICASDLITDELLVVTGQRDGAVYVISASHGYNPILVFPTKALIRLKQSTEVKLKAEGTAIKQKNWQSIGSFFVIHAWKIVSAVVVGLLVLVFAKKFGL